jgi:hypothetical protein
MKTPGHEPASKPHKYRQGQRLYCQNCGSEVEITIPCTAHSTGQVLRCCGHDMTPEVGKAVHMESES